MTTNGKHRLIYLFAASFVIGLASCTPMYTFTTDIRKTVEADSIPINKLQFYVDRDVELRREVSSADTKVSSGVIKFEGGKYVHIIMLKRNTPGVCTKINQNSLQISFETGDGKALTFGVTGVSSPNEAYRIFANEWVNIDGARVGRITYDNQTYYIQAGGEGARLLIKKSAVIKSKVDTQTMSGVKVSN